MRLRVIWYEGSVIQQSTEWTNLTSENFIPSIEARDQLLTSWGARWCEEWDERFIEFESEEDATMFLLRWS